MATFRSIAGAFLLLLSPALAQSPPRPENPTVQGTSFLDHEAPIRDFFGKSFLRDNIPFIDIPNQLIQDVYYYRWTSLQRNLRYVIAGTGFMCTEFVQAVGYGGEFGTINAAAGHQIDESKWLRSHYYADDYIQIYNRGPGNSAQYTEWIADATNRRAMVTGNDDFLVSQLDDMIRGWREWDRVFDPGSGLYYFQPVWDAQEFSLPGYIVDPDGENFDLRKDGPDTYRPSHNAYMVANARAISRVAELANDDATSSEVTQIAARLEQAMLDRMWATEQQFLMDIIRPDNPELSPLTGRQQVGLFPYRFGIGLSEMYAQPAVDAMFDPQGFFSEYGPTTLEIRNEWYMAEKPDGYCEFLFCRCRMCRLLKRHRLLLERPILALLNGPLPPLSRCHLSRRSHQFNCRRLRTVPFNLRRYAREERKPICGRKSLSTPPSLERRQPEPFRALRSFHIQ
jgi:hypothetical protein